MNIFNSLFKLKVLRVLAPSKKGQKDYLKCISSLKTLRVVYAFDINNTLTTFYKAFLAQPYSS